jgi:hypothetical protein
MATDAIKNIVAEMKAAKDNDELRKIIEIGLKDKNLKPNEVEDLKKQLLKVPPPVEKPQPIKDLDKKFKAKLEENIKANKTGYVRNGGIHHIKAIVDELKILKLLEGK